MKNKLRTLFYEVIIATIVSMAAFGLVQMITHNTDLAVVAGVIVGMLTSRDRFLVK